MLGGLPSSELSSSECLFIFITGNTLFGEEAESGPAPHQLIWTLSFVSIEKIIALNNYLSMRSI